MINKVFKVILYGIIVFFAVSYIVFTYVTRPSSTAAIMATYHDQGIQPVIEKNTYKHFEYRALRINIDTVLPTIVFVHGTIGSVRDFETYIKTIALRKTANIIAYDRIGYNYQSKDDVQESIAFERDMLINILQPLNKKKIILIGYSYGGPIVLSVKEKFKKVMLLAPALYSEVEPMPWLVNLYKWKWTRWLIPEIWKQASKEKLSHKSDLKKFERDWQRNPNDLVVIHGDADRIVPYQNSKLLEQVYPKSRFELITIRGAGHGLVWTSFERIYEVISKQLEV